MNPARLLHHLPTALLALLPLLIAAACDDNEGYRYPSVKLELVTIVADGNGTIATLVPDEGDPLPVASDRTGTNIEADSERRVLSNYEVVEADGQPMADIYSLQAVITPAPQSPQDAKFDPAQMQDPVEVTSIWMGRNYLNMLLNVKVKGGTSHMFAVLKEELPATADSRRTVRLTLFHNANGDQELYNRNAYVSIPLQSVADDDGSPVRIEFCYYTRNDDGSVSLSEQYSGTGFAGFEYTPR